MAVNKYFYEIAYDRHQQKWIVISYPYDEIRDRILLLKVKDKNGKERKLHPQYTLNRDYAIERARQLTSLTKSYLR